VRKIVVFVFLLVFLPLYFPSRADASLLVVKKDGQVVANVLASETSLALGVPVRGQLGVTDVVAGGSSNENISLSKENDKISLKVGSDKTYDVSNWKDNIIEIEERPEVKSIKIELLEGKFRIESDGVFALTDLPITIDPAKNKFSVTTPTGERYVSILPSDAIQTVLRAKSLTETQTGMDLIEEGGILSYLIKGDKNVNFFDFYKMKVPVTAKVSASTGEIVVIDQPPWLRVLSFILG
jgi:hypothetical protein